MSLHKLTLVELQKQFTAGEVTATEIVRSYFLRISQVEPKVKAFVTQTKESASLQAEALDRKLKEWRKTKPLTGMPLAIKDNICTDGVHTTCSSRMLQNFIPPYDATAVAKPELFSDGTEHDDATGRRFQCRDEDAVIATRDGAGANGTCSRSRGRLPTRRRSTATRSHWD